MLTFGVVVLGVTDRQRAMEFWCAALFFRLRDAATAFDHRLRVGLSHTEASQLETLRAQRRLFARVASPSEPTLVAGASRIPTAASRRAG